ncbi:hypothetical protein EDB89DRAFT_1995635 [Lactarius sanguifluus]|nr:hypothetical protein EDB89DRAFT_1995635 [Lactarius sanguifluus]
MVRKTVVTGEHASVSVLFTFSALSLLPVPAVSSRNYDAIMAVTTLTADNHDLWFALRSGGNNFGVVTTRKFTVKLHLQGQVWGGNIVYGSDQLELGATITKFSQVTDTNATPVSAFLYTSGEASRVSRV